MSEDTEYELADFEPSTGHLHECTRVDCACAGHLYAIAQDAEIVVARLHPTQPEGEQQP